MLKDLHFVHNKIFLRLALGLIWIYFRSSKLTFSKTYNHFSNGKAIFANGNGKTLKNIMGNGNLPPPLHAPLIHVQII